MAILGGVNEEHRSRCMEKRKRENENALLQCQALKYDDYSSQPPWPTTSVCCISPSLAFIAQR